MAAPVARERQAIYLCEMMERLGIEPGGGMAPHLGLSYATALRRCGACPFKEACRDWLDSMPKSVAFAPRFCPNADIFFELQVDQPVASAGHDRSIPHLGRHLPGVRRCDETGPHRAEVRRSPRTPRVPVSVVQ